jgi:hypothetical protein
VFGFISAFGVHSAEVVPAEIDSLVVLGKQLGIGSSIADVRSSEDHLSVDSRINVTAAGMLWQPGRRILLSGNSRAFFPQAAGEFLAKNFSHIPQVYYENPDEDSPDTLASAENVPAILRAEGYRRAALITVGYHAIRAANLFEQEGAADLIECVIAAEDIVATRSEGDARSISDWKRSRRVRETAKELVLRTFDRRGKVGRLAARAWRP